MKKVSRIAFDFVLEQLERLQPVARPMFGCHAVYIGPKIMLVTRERNTDSDDGVWIATSTEHHDSLRKELPSLRSIKVLGKSVTKWQIIPRESDSFEEEVLHACELILRNDARIGNIPPKKKKNARPKKTRKR